MGGLGALLALLAPAAAGAMFIKGWLPGRGAGLWALSVGVGYPLGLLAAAALLGVQGRVFGSLAPWLLLGGWLAAAVVLGVRLERRGDLALGELPWAEARVPQAWRSPSVWLPAAILTLLGLRLVSLAIEQWSLGLFAWDAFSTWSYRARVWVEAGQWVPFVFPEAWLADRESGARALGAAHYPTLISLVSAWPALAAGRWHESLANLPWLGLFVALGAGVYGFSRRWGLGVVPALIGPWALLSLPLVGGQIALAGYADIWLATVLGFAFAAALIAQRDGDRRFLLLSVALALTGVFIKAEGLVWLAFFIPMAIVYRWGLKGWIAIGGLAVAVVGLLAVTGGLNFSVPGLGAVSLSLDRVATARTGVFEFVSQEGVLTPLLVHLLVFGSWHLLVPVLALAIAGSVGSLAREDSGLLAERWQQGAFVWVLSAIAAFYLLFFWTPAAEWVRLGTSVNRIMLHFAPALVFWLMTLWHSIERRSAS